MKAKRSVLGKRLAAIFMSVAMALVFMPIMGASVYGETEWNGQCVGWIDGKNDTEDYSYIPTDIDRGDSVTLKVQAIKEYYYDPDNDEMVQVGYENVTYQWEEGELIYGEGDEENTWNGTPISGATNASYKADKLKKDSYYRCTVKDNVSDTTASIVFFIHVEPVSVSGWVNDDLEGESSEVYANKYHGEDLTLHIQAYDPDYLDENGMRVDYDENATYRWEIGTYEDNPDPNEDPVWAGEVITGATESSYKITDLEDETIFRGYVVDSDGDIYGYVTYEVSPLPLETYLKGWIKNKSDGDYDIAVNPGTAVTLNAELLYYDWRAEKNVPVTGDVQYEWTAGYWDENDVWVETDVIATQTMQGKPSSVTVRPNEDMAYLCAASSDTYGSDTASFYIMTNARDVAGYNVSQMIDDLKPVEQLTLNDKDAVMKAKAAYDALSAEQRENWIDSSQETKLLKAVLKIQELQKQADDKAAADKAAAQMAAQVSAYKNTVAAAKKLNVSGLSVKAKAKKATITWKVNKKATGYVVQYSMKKNFKKGVKKVKVKKAKTKKLVVKKLKAGKTYYFRIATYKQVKNPTTGKVVTTQGKWSKAKKVKVK